jgi:Mrp family chromosome partitioning ATPase
MLLPSHRLERAGQTAIFEEGINPVSRERIMAFLWRRRFYIGPGFLITLFACVVGGYYSPTQSRARITLYVHSKQFDFSNQDSILLSKQLGETGQVTSAETHAWLLQSKPLQRLALGQLNPIVKKRLDRGYKVSVEDVEKTNLINLTVEASDRRAAADLVRALCKTYLTESQSLQRRRAQQLCAQLARQEALLRNYLKAPNYSIGEGHQHPISKTATPLQSDVAKVIQESEEFIQNGNTTPEKQDVMPHDRSGQQANTVTRLTDKRTKVNKNVTPISLKSLNSLQQVYEKIQHRLQELRVEEATAGPEAHLLESPLGVDVVTEQKWLRTTLLILVAGLWCTLCLAAVIDQIDDRPHSFDEIIRDTGFPLWGWLAQGKISGGLALSLPDDVLQLSRHVYMRLAIVSHTNEQPRTLLRWPEERKYLSVMNSDIEEHKSMTALGIALSFVQEGHRVILVATGVTNEALYQSLLPHQLNLHGSSGRFPDWGSYRLNLNKTDLERLVQTTSVEGLRLLVIDNQSAEDKDEFKNFLPEKKRDLCKLNDMAGGTWAAFLKQLSELPETDVIVFDAPPLLSASSVMHLASLSDAIIFHVSCESVSRKALRLVTEQLRSMNSPVVGMLINEVSPGIYRGQNDKTFHS